MNTDIYYMDQALLQAHISLEKGEVPVGCVIVDGNGVIIGRGHNEMEHGCSQFAHAEVSALAQATKERGGWRLDECTVYVTLEPCMMCLGALLLSRVAKIVYGASSPLFGAVKIVNYLPTAYTTHTLFSQGVLEEQCSAVLKAFFSKIRDAKKEKNVSEKSSFLTTIKEQLLVRKRELAGHLHSDRPQDGDKQVKDLGDEALSASMSNLQSSLEQAEIDELNLIDDALTRIEDGVYGVCIDCDEAISPRRLEYSPYVARCIPCQEELEQQGGAR